MLKAVFALLLLTSLKVGQIASQNATNEIFYSSGESGASCGSKRTCISGAECSGTTCRCSGGLQGDALFACFKQDQQACFLLGETRVKSFSGDSALVSLPCSFRVTRFVVPLQDSSDVRATCSVEVFATNHAHENTFRVGALYVAVGINQPAKGLLRTSEVVVTGTHTPKDYNKQQKAKYRYRVQSSGVHSMKWSSGPSGDVSNPIQTSVDRVDNMAVLRLPECSTLIKFRTFDPSKYSQRQVPGVAIVIPESASFSAGFGDYPNSICGSPKHSVYKTRTNTLGMKNTATTLLTDILHQNFSQIENSKLSSKCKEASKYLSLQKSRDLTEVLGICGTFLTQKSFRTCMTTRGFEPIDAFNQCLQAKAYPGDPAACQFLKSLQDVCFDKEWLAKSNLC